MGEMENINEKKAEVINHLIVHIRDLEHYCSKQLRQGHFKESFSEDAKALSNTAINFIERQLHKFFDSTIDSFKGELQSLNLKMDNSNHEFSQEEFATNSVRDSMMAVGYERMGTVLATASENMVVAKWLINHDKPFSFAGMVDPREVNYSILFKWFFPIDDTRKFYDFPLRIAVVDLSGGISFVGGPHDLSTLESISQ
jgi:hypothetical protein